MNDFNKIYDDTVVKYTLNIPLEIWGKVAQNTRKGTKYHGRKSTFIREAIEEKLLKTVFRERPISIKRLLEIEKEARESDSGYIYEPPRKYSGFVAGLLRNPFVLRWFKNRQELRKI